MSNAAYALTPARYAKKSMALRVHDSVQGMKGRASRLADALNGRWSNREHAYILSETKAAKFVALYESGRDAELHFLSSTNAVYVLQPGPAVPRRKSSTQAWYEEMRREHNANGSEHLASARKKMGA